MSQDERQDGRQFLFHPIPWKDPILLLSRAMIDPFVDHGRMVGSSRRAHISQTSTGSSACQPESSPLTWHPARQTDW